MLSNKKTWYSVNLQILKKFDRIQKNCIKWVYKNNGLIFSSIEILKSQKWIA